MPPAAVDVLTECAVKSLARFLSSTLTGYSGVWLASPDFEFDRRPSVLAPGTKEPRPRPFVAIEVREDESLPYELGNARLTRRIPLWIWVACESFDAYLRRPAQVRQALQTAADGLDELHETIPLIDFTAPLEPVVGRVEVRSPRVLPLLEHFPAPAGEKANLKGLQHCGVVSASIEAEKARESALL